MDLITDTVRVTERIYSEPDAHGYRRLEAPAGGRIPIRRAQELGLFEDGKTTKAEPPPASEPPVMGAPSTEIGRAQMFPPSEAR